MTSPAQTRERWGIEVALPSGGSQVRVDRPLTTVEPMGDNGARIKWAAPTPREVRVSVEPMLLDGVLGDLMAVTNKFELQLVGDTTLNEDEGMLYALRGVDPRRHVVVATRSLRNKFSTQLSFEASATDVVEVTDEWSVLDAAYDSMRSVTQQLDGAQLQLSFISDEHRIRFELPPDVHLAQWAYGMAQLRRRGVGHLGPVSFGVIAADDADVAKAAFDKLADDPGLSVIETYINEGTAVVQADLVDSRQLQASLLVAAQPVGRGVCLMASTLLFDDDEGDAMVDVINHALESAKTFGRARKPRASADPRDVLRPIDSFRHRLDANGERVE